MKAKTIGLAVVLLAAIAPPVHAAVDLVPDLIIRVNDLYDHDIVTSIQPGHVHLRLSNGTPNIGDGKLYLYGVLPAYPDGTQDVMQRVYRSDGTYYDRPAGRFIYHPTHNHIHLEDWCIYRLREVLPGDGVGPIVAEGSKTSFCVEDLAVYDNSLPNFDTDGQFHSCGTTTQGLSVGWVDVYSKTLSGQNIDVTGLADGVYWLESEADPDNHILEKSEANNVARIKVTIGQPGSINPDAYEPNDSTVVTDTRPVGGIVSPNLGPCGPQRVINGLTIDHAGEKDVYKFYVNHKGGSGDFVRIDFTHSLGDVDLKLYNSSGSQVGSSTGTTNVENISLQNRSEGWYYAQVYGYNGATNPAYTLTINPSQNSAPSVTVLNPPTGNVRVEHAVENYVVTWNATDPEADLTWVTVYVNTVPNLDGNQVMLQTTLNTPGSQGLAPINSVELEPGTYWVYCSVTDGGTVTGSWSQGTITFYEHDATDAPAPIAGPVTRMLPAYPNPFNPSTTLRLDLARAGHVRWRIYDANGRSVRTLLDRELAAGRYVESWDGADASGRRVGSGIYYAVAESPHGVARQKLVLMR
jgi:hypothetical protein